MKKKTPTLIRGLSLGFMEDYSLTLADIIEAAAVNFPGISDAELFFTHDETTPYDLILRKKLPIEFQEDVSGFQRHVHGIITLDQVKKEAQALPDFANYGFAKVRIFWAKWDFCMFIRK